jgi:hypothetical protein
MLVHHLNIKFSLLKISFSIVEVLRKCFKVLNGIEDFNVSFRN